jgi:hypothetical protein
MSIALIFLSVSRMSYAQQGSISGTVRDADGPIDAATVSLLRDKDSGWIQSAITDDSGAYRLSGIAAGNYLISITMLGYTGQMHTVSVAGNEMKQQNFLLAKDNTTLKEVTVAAKAPFMETSLGKVTVNVAASPTTIGLNALELLRKMPGVIVDQAGSISMLGKQGVLVLIDDKPTYLSSDQLAGYLKAMPADELEQVELITQPSSKYDAAGNAGIINLKRKKIKSAGLNCTATATEGQGIYGYTVASVLVNYKIKKLNILLSGDENRATGFANWKETQNISDPASGARQNITNIESSALEHFSISNLRLAADYDISPKATAGASIKGGYHTNTMLDQVHAATTDLITNTMTSDTIISPEGFIRKDLTANAYLMYKFNSERMLNFNFDYLNYSNSPFQNIFNTTYDARMQPLPDPLVLQSHQPTLINIYSFRGDYTDTLGNGTKLEAGFKSSFVNTDNNAAFNIFQNNEWAPDTTRSNRFIYKENINALYISGSKKLSSKWEIRAGLRAENTNAQGIQQVHNEQFNRSYVSLFPTAFIGYKKDKDNQFELNYGRRIDRPSYQSLNPFIYYSFQYNYAVGNPQLQPQYTNSIELKHSYKNMLITTITVTNTTGVINSILVANNNTGVIYSTQNNVGTNNAVNLSLVFNKDIFKWWSANAYLSIFYAHYDGMVNGYNLITTGPGVFTGITNQFSFIKGWKAEAGAYYNGNYVESIISKGLPSLYLATGITKKIDRASTVKIAVDDPFYSYRYKNETTLPGLQTSAVYRSNSQVINVAYTYTFGSNSSRHHETTATDEAKRIK